MIKSTERRLAALERDLRPIEGWRVVVFRIVEPDKSLSLVDRYQSSDGRHFWTRQAIEGVAEFIDRVSEEASRLALKAPMALMPSETARN
jgi:hypothetical protein